TDNPKNESCKGITLRSRELPNLEVVEKLKKKKEIEVPSPHAMVPYPRKKKVKNQDREFHKFMEVLNKLEMAIPLVEALEEMPTYAKFLKELLTKKRKPVEDDTMDMTEECSALIQ
ncbi:hypothetical protein L195_g061823, partial [Trifolium pratense]